MEKISISNVVEFRRKSPASQITLMNNLRKIKKDESSSESKGNYWIHSLSTVSTVFVSEQTDLLSEKIDVLHEKHQKATARISKTMYNRNIDILHNFEDFDFSQLKPHCEIKLLSKPKSKSIITIEGVPIQVLPHHVYSFKVKGVQKIGAIWFVAKIGGYRIEELAFFTDALYRYLNVNYSDKFVVDSVFCSSVDVMSLANLPYDQISKRKIPTLLNHTLKGIKVLIIE